MPLGLLGSGLIAAVMTRVPWLALVGSGVLAWTSGHMIVGDDIVGQWVPYDEALMVIVPIVLLGAILSRLVGADRRRVAAGDPTSAIVQHRRVPPGHRADGSGSLPRSKLLRALDSFD